MSERKSFRETYRIQFIGVDTARYAITAADTSISLDLTSNGFYAFNRGINSPKTIRLNIANLIKKDTLASQQITLQTESYMDSIRAQLDLRGVASVSPISTSINLTLQPRRSKTFVPSIENVKFQFEGMIGICGEPIVKPSTVTLYGSQESLDKINSLSAMPQIIKHIRSTGTHTVALQPDWEQFPDLRVSTPTIDIFLPVEPYIQREFTLPVTLTDTTSQYRLYPDQVSVTVLIPRKDYFTVTANDFRVIATPDIDTKGILRLSVSQFPANVRVKSLSHTTVQYIIIK